MGFGGTALKLLSPLMLEAEPHRQITASCSFRVCFSQKYPLHTIKKDIFSDGLCLPNVILPCQSLLKTLNSYGECYHPSC